MELQTALARLEEIQRTCHAYTHALSVLNYDGATVAPEKSARGRAETGAVLGGVVYDLLTGSELQGILEFLAARPAELTAEQRRQVELLKESFDQTACIPREEYLAYTRLQTEADAVWHRAKPANDFAAFAPCLEQLIDYNRCFALYYKPDRTPTRRCSTSSKRASPSRGLTASSVCCASGWCRSSAASARPRPSTTACCT